jgi:hypothetical protein
LHKIKKSLHELRPSQQIFRKPMAQIMIPCFRHLVTQ